MTGIAMTPETLALRELIDLIDARRDEFQVLLDRYGASRPRSDAGTGMLGVATCAWCLVRRR